MHSLGLPPKRLRDAYNQKPLIGIAFFVLRKVNAYELLKELSLRAFDLHISPVSREHLMQKTAKQPVLNTRKKRGRTDQFDPYHHL